MPWLKLDDNFPEHEKVLNLSDRGFRLHVAALCYCARNLTDGLVTDRSARIVGAVIGATNPKRWIQELVDAGLWLETEDGDGFEIKDFLDYNPTSDEVKDQRRKNRERQAEFRRRKQSGNAVSNGVTDDNVTPLVTGPRPVPSRPVKKNPKAVADDGHTEAVQAAVENSLRTSISGKAGQP